MDTSNIAIFISIFSIMIAALSLGWNVYRDIILKARVQVRFFVGFISHPTIKNPPDQLFLSVTNFGPGKIRLQMLQLRETSLLKRILKKTKHAVLIHDFTNPLSAQLPCELDVGDGKDFLLKLDKKCFLSEPWNLIGISDCFGRVHWASKKQVRKSKKTYYEKFSNIHS